MTQCPENRRMEKLFKGLQFLLCSSTTSIWGESILAVKYHNIKTFYREGKKWWRYLLWFCVDVCVVNAHFDVEGEQLPKFDATTVSCQTGWSAHCQFCFTATQRSCSRPVAISSASSSALDCVDDNPESKLLDTQTEGDVQDFINWYFSPEIARKFKITSWMFSRPCKGMHYGSISYVSGHLGCIIMMW